MPVNLLLVEGDLDQELLVPILSVGVTVEAIKADKHALLARTRFERAKHLPGVFYLRDRDFDHEPEAVADTPAVDRHDDQRILGWRWHRHAIESYMLEPAIVTKAYGLDMREYEAMVLAAAADLRYYTAARWTIGLARNSMPRSWQLATAWTKDEFKLPDDENLQPDVCLTWMLQHCRAHLSEVQTSLDDAALRSAYGAWCDRLASAENCTPSKILVYHSGKDLMSKIAPRLPGAPTPHQFRTTLRDWIREHPEEATSALVEWARLKEILKAA